MQQIRVGDRLHLVNVLVTAVDGGKATTAIEDTARIPWDPINTVSQVYSDEQLRVRDFIWECEHPTAGTIKLSGSPMHFSDTPTGLYKASPLLGEDNEEMGVLE